MVQWMTAVLKETRLQKALPGITRRDALIDVSPIGKDVTRNDCILHQSLYSENSCSFYGPGILQEEGNHCQRQRIRLSFVVG